MRKQAHSLPVSVFECQSTLMWLNEVIKRFKDERGYKASLANAAGCQRSYMSQVLSGMANLQPEQALGLSRFWGFSQMEEEYFLTLTNYERSGTLNLKVYYKKQMQDCVKRYQDLSQQFQAPKANEAAMELYYSNWIYSAIHMACTIPSLQTTDALSSRFGLKKSRLQELLLQLEIHQFVRKEHDRWIAIQTIMHLPAGSNSNILNHWNWRQEAIHHISYKKGTGGIHYTAVYTLSVQDYERLNAMVMKFISETRQLVEPSKEEQLVGFLCDLWTIGE